VHRGKAEALNSGVAMATGEVVLFADARQRFERRAIRELVANFADASVGAVSGELVLLDGQGKEASDAVGAYWRYEKTLRAMESDIHSVPGATGAIYAIRRELFVPLSMGTILDDVMIPMRIVLAGKRVIFDPAAQAYEVADRDMREEYERRIRTLAGNYQLFAMMPELLAPWRNRLFVQVVSHKLGRLVVPYCLLALFVANLFLLHGFYLAVFAGQVLWYALAGIGWFISTRGAAARCNAAPTVPACPKPLRAAGLMDRADVMHKVLRGSQLPQNAPATAPWADVEAICPRPTAVQRPGPERESARAQRLNQRLAVSKRTA
jgi:cellulose synthase/poly-beta-1,6-N-acetylglucosamine synthase-like glycosyltransferase